jgi:hypothetical protein
MSQVASIRSGGGWVVRDFRQGGRNCSRPTRAFRRRLVVPRLALGHGVRRGVCLPWWPPFVFVKAKFKRGFHSFKHLVDTIFYFVVTRLVKNLFIYYFCF